MFVANKVGNYFDVYMKRSKCAADVLLNIGIIVSNNFKLHGFIKYECI